MANFRFIKRRGCEWERERANGCARMERLASQPIDGQDLDGKQSDDEDRGSEDVEHYGDRNYNHGDGAARLKSSPMIRISSSSLNKNQK